jgi:succinoglycan biosynthesis protein ExoV
MKLYYFTKSSNFGDSLNAWLWERLLPGAWDPEDGVSFAGIGTIINAQMPVAERWIVFGSGVGYGSLPKHFGAGQWTVLAVRGPLSAALLGLQPGASVTDGAALLATLPEYAPLSSAERAGVVFVPHFEAERGAAWSVACGRAGVEYINPIDNSRAIIDRIRRARLVIAEAMHAAIVADAVRVPWVPVVSSPQVSTFKWLDWTSSLNLPYTPSRIRASSAAVQLRNAMLWAYGQTHEFSHRRKGAPLDYYTTRYQSRPSGARSEVQRLGRRVHRRAEKWLASPRLSTWRARHDERAINRAAADLAGLADNAGMLSDEPVFRQRVDVLVERLASLTHR